MGRRLRSRAEPMRARFCSAYSGRVAAALLVAGFLGYCAFTLPLAGGGIAEPTAAAIVLTAADGQVFAARGVSKGDRVTIDQLPPDLVHAFIAIEDRRFYAHHGIDIRGILRAAWHNLRGVGAPQGAARSPSNWCVSNTCHPSVRCGARCRRSCSLCGSKHG